MLSIAKLSDLSVNFVDQTIQGLVDHLISLIQQAKDTKHLRIRLNMKIGHIQIGSGKCLQFFAESYQNILNPPKISI